MEEKLEKTLPDVSRCPGLYTRPKLDLNVTYRARCSGAAGESKWQLLSVAGPLLVESSGEKSLPKKLKIDKEYLMKSI